MKTIGKCAMQSELSCIQVLFFIFDELDGFPSKLEQKGFPRRDVDHGKLDTTDVGACHCNLLHVVHTANSLDE